jgi:hypothetical protein
MTAAKATDEMHLPALSSTSRLSSQFRSISWKAGYSHNPRCFVTKEHYSPRQTYIINCSCPPFAAAGGFVSSDSGQLAILNAARMTSANEDYDYLFKSKRTSVAECIQFE